MSPDAHDIFAEQIAKAHVLVEALPYMQMFRGQTFVIKIGGSAMDDHQLVKDLLRDIVFLEVIGINPVLVHGGGKAISKAMKDAGLEARFVGGLRVTDSASIGIVEKTLGEVINPGLVSGVQEAGGAAVGVPGMTVFVAEKAASGRDENGGEVDLGFVGKVIDCDLEVIHSAISIDTVPILSPLGKDRESGQVYNVNADVAAAALASKLRASKLLFLSDVLGVMRSPGDPSSLVPTVTGSDADELFRSGVLSGGMIPKVGSSLEALQAGVGKVHLIDGRIPHSLLLEIFTKDGIGTQIVQ